MSWLLISVAVLHAAFMACELLPWSNPVLLRLASKKLPSGSQWSVAQLSLVASTVHNAGIYNGIIAGGALWAALGGDPSGNVARVVLAGALVAGVFGTVTRRSPITALQAVLGIVWLVII